jgi:hypothetical protein
MNIRKYCILFLHAFIGWGLCGATIGIGRELFTMHTTLIVHAIMAPLIFFVVSYIYFRRFHYTQALKTALAFVFFVMAIDAGIVAPFIEKSYGMFKSILGTWLPFTLIFAATFLTGLCFKKRLPSGESL